MLVQPRTESPRNRPHTLIQYVGSGGLSDKPVPIRCFVYIILISDNSEDLVNSLAVTEEDAAVGELESYERDERHVACYG